MLDVSTATAGQNLRVSAVGPGAWGDRLFVRTLIDIAQHLGIATAAEWVDDEPKAEMLRTWGADYLEGDLFGKASPAAQPAVPALHAKRA